MSSLLAFRGGDPRLGKLHSIGVELTAHHRQRRLKPRPQAASQSSMLLLYRWFLVSIVSPDITTLGWAAAVGRVKEYRVYGNLMIFQKKGTSGHF